MKTNISISLLALSVLLSCNKKEEKQPEETTSPNIVLLLAEDLSPKLGCYGHPVVKTPNIDKLASEGVRFTNAYCNSPICNPSRTSLLSGLRPETNAVVENFYHFKKFVPDEVTVLPAYLKNNGYETIRIGKLFHKAWDSVWSEVIYPEGKIPDKNKLHKPEKPVPVTDPNLADSILYSFMDHSLKWGSSGQDEQGEHDWEIVRHACDYLKKEHSNPFFLALGFKNTHLPYVCPQKYIDMYSLDDIELPGPPEDDLEDVPDVAYWQFQRIDDLRLSDTEKKEIIRVFYGMTSFLDDCVGKVMNCIEHSGLDNNTIVVFMSDHGLHLGEHHMWRKETLFRESLQVPLIIKIPWLEQNGWVEEDIFELVDIYPTFADMAGLNIPGFCEGRSFLPHLENSEKTASFNTYGIVKQGDRVDESIGRSIISGNWHYIEWDSDPGMSELYNMKNDPHEYTNLANDESYFDKKNELRLKLNSVALNPKIFELKNTTKNE